MKIIHQKSGTVLGKNVMAATSFWRRLRGYMFYTTPPSVFDGLYFPNSNMVHNSFVRFPLDVIFTNKSNAVIAVIRGFKPWHFTRIYSKAAHAIEFPAGTVPDIVTLGDQIILEN